MLMEAWQQVFSGMHKPMRGDLLEAGGQGRRDTSKRSTAMGGTACSNQVTLACS